VKACKLPMTGLRFVAVVLVPHVASVQVASRAVRTYVSGPNRRTSSAQSKTPPLRPSGARSKSAPPCSCLLACVAMGKAKAKGRPNPPQPNHHLTKPERVHVHPSKPTLTPRHRRNAKRLARIARSPAYILPGLVSSSRACSPGPAPPLPSSSILLFHPPRGAETNSTRCACACVGRGVRGRQDISRA
jgi:hypothetical protein